MGILARNITNPLDYQRRERRRRNKNLNKTKYEMFKNESRRKRLKFINGFLRFFEVLAFVALFVFLTVAFIAPIVWIFLVVVTLGLILLAEKDIINVAEWFKTGLIGAAISLTAAVILYSLRWIFEWATILVESRELKMQPIAPENEKYIKVAAAVRKAKLFDLMMTIITIAAFTVACAILYFASDKGTTKSDTPSNIATAVIIVIVIALMIFRRIKQTKIFESVSAEVSEIRVERHTALLAAKQEMEERKMNKTT